MIWLKVKKDLKDMKVKVLKFGVKNLNDRIYTKESIENCLENFMVIVKDGKAFGQLGYPDNADIDLKEVSHKVNNVYIDGDYLIADIKILDNVKGKDLNSILNEVVFRTRCVGKMIEGDIIDIDRIISIDAIFKNVDSFEGIIE